MNALAEIGVGVNIGEGEEIAVGAGVAEGNIRLQPYNSATAPPDARTRKEIRN
jgi:hypothetical protein